MKIILKDKNEIDFLLKNFFPRISGSIPKVGGNIIKF
jgi:hypothetical protein